ncbi:MAG: nitroreductase family deazaflavin-dependent oxidoreductase [Chloroflexota bacterium]
MTNRLTLPLAKYLPAFGVIAHTGRRTRRVYRTPLNVFRGDNDHYVVALTYGPDVEWLKNLEASGGGELETLGQTWTVTEPRVFHDERRAAMPQPVRSFLGLAKVHDFVELKRRPKQLTGDFHPAPKEQ